MVESGPGSGPGRSKVTRAFRHTSSPRSDISAGFNQEARRGGAPTGTQKKARALFGSPRLEFVWRPEEHPPRRFVAIARTALRGSSRLGGHAGGMSPGWNGREGKRSVERPGKPGPGRAGGSVFRCRSAELSARLPLSPSSGGGPAIVRDGRSERPRRQPARQTACGRAAPPPPEPVSVPDPSPLSGGRCGEYGMGEKGWG